VFRLLPPAGIGSNDAIASESKSSLPPDVAPDVRSYQAGVASATAAADQLMQASDQVMVDTDMRPQPQDGAADMIISAQHTS